MRTSPRPVWQLVLLDTLVLGMALCVFAYFHHVRMLWGIHAVEATPLMTFNIPSRTSTALPTATTLPSQATVSSSTASTLSPATPLPNGTTPVPLPTDPPVITPQPEEQGDFGAFFPGMFTAKGVINVDNAHYQSHDISMTIKEYNTTFQSGGSTYKLRYIVYDFYVRYLKNLYTMYSTSTSKDITQWVAESASLKNADSTPWTNGACIACMNGDYLGNANHTLLAERNGKLLRQTDALKSDICVLYSDGIMETYTPDTYNWNAIAARSPYQIWDFGPALLDANGAPLSSFSANNYDANVIAGRNPRTAIGYYQPGHYCLVVVDGRCEHSAGLTAAQLSQLMASLGCVRAYNMDGGDSSQAYYNGQMLRLDEERIGKTPQRPLYDVICVGEVA